MDPVFYPIIFFIVAVVAAYWVARKIGYRTIGWFFVLGLVGYAICAVSFTQSTGEFAGLAQILIATFIITPILIGAMVGAAIGGYHKQRRMLERLNDQ